MDQSTLIVVIVCGSIICLSLLLLLIYWGVSLSRWDDFSGALGVSIDNSLFCVPDEGSCRLISDDALEHPVEFGGDFSYTTASFIADLIARVQLLFRDKYSERHLQMPPNFEHRKTLYFDNQIIGFIGQSTISQVFWIAFRGTSTDEEWRKDYQFMQSNTVFSENTTKEKQLHEQQRLFTETLSCHRGFLDVYDQVRPAIQAMFANSGPETIIIGGHSLGASIATLACLDLHVNHKVHGYVFGSPRVCQMIPDSLTLFRIENTCDLIPSVPLSVMWNIGDHNKPYMFQHGGTLLTFTQNRSSLTNNHLMPIYIEALAKRRLEQVTRMHE